MILRSRTPRSLVILALFGYGVLSSAISAGWFVASWLDFFKRSLQWATISTIDAQVLFGVHGLALVTASNLTMQWSGPSLLRSTPERLRAARLIISFVLFIALAIMTVSFWLASDGKQSTGVLLLQPFLATLALATSVYIAVRGAMYPTAVFPSWVVDVTRNPLLFFYKKIRRL